MEIPFLAPIAAVALASAIPGIAAWWLAQVTARIASLKTRLFRAYLTAELVAVRRSDYIDRGLHLKNARLKGHVAREVRVFASRLKLPARMSGFSSWDYFRLMSPQQRGAAVREMWSDLMPAVANEEHSHKTDKRLWERKRANANALTQIFHGILETVERHYVRTFAVVAAGWSLLIAVLFPRDVWDPLRVASTSSIAGLLGSAAAIALAAMVCELVARRLAPRTEETFPDVDLTEPPAPPPTPDGTAHQAEIAPGRGVVRALNFAGGGLDAIMQLGVTHALLVLQGRAPDAIIGVSAGSITAAAAAEVLQEGADLQPGPRLQAQLHRLTMSIEAAQRAPGEIIDTLFPDAYQIDSLDPLGPLYQPRFAQKERDERLGASVTRSGLARLYNDLLNLEVPIGTIARLIRRGLGMNAMRELPRMSQGLALFGEFISLLTLLRQNMRQVSSLLPTLLTPLFAGRVGAARPMTAGGLLFFGSWTRSRLWRRLVKIFFFLALMLVWLAVLLLPAVAVEWSWTHGLGPWSLLIPIVIITTYILHVRRTEQLRLAGTLQLFVSLVAAYALGTAAALSLFLALAAIGFTLRATAFWIALEPHSAMQLSKAILQSMSPVKDFVLGAAHIITLSGWVLMGVVGLWAWNRIRDDNYKDLILGVYGLRRSIFQNYGLRHFLMRHFDRDCYGAADPDSVLVNALRRVDTPAERRYVPPKDVGYYSRASRNPPIHLGIAVADASTGELGRAPADMGLVKALTASCAVTPLFPPVEHQGRVLIDGVNIANQPTRAMIDLLRPLLHNTEKVVHVYSVSPFPLSQPLGRDLDEYVNLVDIAKRAILLRRKRDALFEHNLTKRITDALPPAAQDRRGFFAAWVIPIELETARSLNLGLLGAETEERRKLVLEAVADGCRASLQAMLKNPDSPTLVPCDQAVAEYFVRQGAANQFPVGIMHNNAPGLKEVCEHCCLHRGADGPGNERRLKFPASTGGVNEWPHQGNTSSESNSQDHDPRIELTKDDQEQPGRISAWMADERHYRPLVSCVFGGGVFRGVYQVGVLNGLNEIGLTPNIMAGASVGSITAAMTARAFSLKSGERMKHIARIAAVYIGMDRLILTDRFADFVRNFTLQAADTGFSIRDADRFFRKYDRIGSAEFGKGARSVLAGLERLLGIHPYAVNRLAKGIREGNWERVGRDLSGRVQGWLDRMQVGDEVLGAEPLRELIREYVERGPSDTFQTLLDDGVLMMATATNLTEGKMNVILSSDAVPTRLAEGLLASSAFPAVFRPRWSWELSDSAQRCQYIDGGVMDNLPIESVTTFLDQLPLDDTCNDKWTPEWKEHLIVVGSLESNVHPQVTYMERRDLLRNWRSLAARAKKLGYNQKLDKYVWAERERGKFLRAHGRTEPPIRIVAIKPEWLCGTFAAHPMLGFRKEKQKRSIAHGCASTLIRFAEPQLKSKLNCWNAQGTVSEASNWGDAFHLLQTHPDRMAKGMCWLRDAPCPFSENELKKLGTTKPGDDGLPMSLIKELSHIHRLCSSPVTQLNQG